MKTNGKELCVQAASFGGTNIDPTAWEDKKNPGESRFPAQVYHKSLFFCLRCLQPLVVVKMCIGLVYLCLDSSSLNERLRLLLVKLFTE